MHAPAHYVTDAHDARRQCLQGLALAGRLALILGVPRGLKRRRCVWLVVFATRELREQLLRAKDAHGGPWVLM